MYKKNYFLGYWIYLTKQSEKYYTCIQEAQARLKTFQPNGMDWELNLSKKEAAEQNPWRKLEW